MNAKKNKMKTKENKTEKGKMASVKIPGGCKFAPLVANQLWRANQHEQACFGLSSPESFPSCSGILLHAVVQA